MRGNASDEMRRAAVMHLEGKAHGGGFLVKRTYCHLRNLLADEQVRSGQINPAVGKGRLISVMLQVVRRKATIADLQAVDSSIAQAAFDIATSERDALDLYLKNPSLVDALPHAHRYSIWAEQWAVQRYVHKGDAEDVIHQKKAFLKLWRDAEVKLPKPFSILPVQRLQRRMVHYEGTALAAFFCHWETAERHRGIGWGVGGRSIRIHRRQLDRGTQTLDGALPRGSPPQAGA
jgi:hypothetical protein